MKSISSVCVLAAIVSVTNAQFGGGFFGRGPFFGGWGFPGIDPLTAALFFGFDYNELMALSTLAGHTRSLRPGAQQQTMRDIEALSALGLIDGPDAPDGRRGAGKGRAGSGPRGGGRARAGESEGGGAKGGRQSGRGGGGRGRRNRNRRQ